MRHRWYAQRKQDYARRRLSFFHAWRAPVRRYGRECRLPVPAMSHVHVEQLQRMLGTHNTDAMFNTRHVCLVFLSCRSCLVCKASHSTMTNTHTSQPMFVTKRGHVSAPPVSRQMSKAKGKACQMQNAAAKNKCKPKIQTKAKSCLSERENEKE